MTINVGLLGYGHIGAGVAKILSLEDSLICQKLGCPLRLVKAVVRDLRAQRQFPPPPGLLTVNPYEVVGREDIQIVVEVMGGIEPARSLILESLAKGQYVVTANKALLATKGQEIFEKAAQAGRDVMFEAAVAGAIPIIRTLKEGLSANRILNLFGILNGTTNYILTRMSQDLVSFDEALKEAQKEGYAEADPSSDVNGLDAAHKLILLTALAYGILPRLEDIHVEGISQIEPIDFTFAAEFGCVIKLLALASQNGSDGRLEVKLHPAMLPKNHLLAGVSGVMNAVVIRGHASGDIFFSGAGAGMMPTASSVVGDIIEIARALGSGTSSTHLRTPSLGWQSLKGEMVKPMSETWSNFYLRCTVLDRPGVLSSISGVFSRHGISIAQVIQKDSNQKKGEVSLVMMTHNAQEKDVNEALLEIEKLEMMTEKTRLIRVETRI
jgi:homoserine dehydrogenase